MSKLHDIMVNGGTVSADNRREGFAWYAGGLPRVKRKQGDKMQRRTYTKRTGVDMWESQLRKGSLALAVLASLWDGQLQGSQIRGHLEQIAGLAVLPGVIYPILRRLEKTRFIESEWMEPRVGHPRRNFRLTESGRRCVLEFSSTRKEFAGGMNPVLAAPDERTQSGSHAT